MEEKTSFTSEVFRFYWLFSEKVTHPMLAAVRANFTRAEFFTLSVIAGHGGLSMLELVERTRMTKQQVTRIVNHLEEGGYVLRVRRKEDRRLVHLCPTEATEQFMREYGHEVTAHLTSALEWLSVSERADFEECLTRLNDLLERLPVGAAPKAES